MESRPASDDRFATPHGVPAGLAPALRGARMSLRAMVAGDRGAYLEAVRETRAELDLFHALHREGESDDAMFDRQLGYARLSGPSAESMRLIGVLGEGAVVGGFNLNAISRGLSWKADITWWVRTGWRGQGLGEEGVRTLLEFALADLPAGLGMHAVHAWISQDNGPSVRLAAKVGMVHDPGARSNMQTGSRWAMHDCYTKRAAAWS